MEFVELQRTIRYHFWSPGLDCYLNTKPPKLSENALYSIKRNSIKVGVSTASASNNCSQIVSQISSLTHKSFTHAVIDCLALLYYKYNCNIWSPNTNSSEEGHSFAEVPWYGKEEGAYICTAHLKSVQRMMPEVGLLWSHELPYQTPPGLPGVKQGGKQSIPGLWSHGLPCCESP